MKVTREEAKESIAIIERTSSQTRKTAGQAAPPILILWGVIWMFGFGLQQFAASWAFKAWPLLDLLGGFLTWRICVRKPAVKSTHDARMLIALLILFCYSAVGCFLLAPISLRHLGAYIVTIVMCGYVMAGLWLGRFYIYLGIGITVLVLAGVLFFPHYENLWLALAGGGSMIASGLYLRGLGSRG